MKNFIAGTFAVLVLLGVLYLIPTKIESLVIKSLQQEQTADWHMDIELAHDGVGDPLRGQVPIPTTNPAPALYHYAPNKGPVGRNYLTQPPVIPHKIEGYEINMRVNKCMVCHSWQNHKDWGATKVSFTHYRDRDGNELDDISPLRYFCTQCHVPQYDAKLAVRNEFRPVESLDAR